MKPILAFLLVLTNLAFCTLTGCGHKFGLDPEKPVTLTLWHNYGGIMRATMDELLDTFNSTVGKEKGILINCTSINSSAVLQEKLLMAAEGDPGAPDLPDITTCYPKVAITPVSYTHLDVYKRQRYGVSLRPDRHRPEQPA